MRDYLVAFSWGICILLSFVGWGTLINRTLFPKQRIDWGQQSAWGLSLCTVLGGFLNLAGIISQLLVLIWVMSGLVTWLVDFASRHRALSNRLLSSIAHFRKDRVFALGSLIVCILVVLQFCAWVHTPFQSRDSYFVFPGESSPVFNIHDDFQAYFVFPAKMLETGSMGREPFSDRRLKTSYGGQSFLHTLVLVVLPEQNLHLLEPGVCFLIVLGLLLGYFAERGTPRRKRIWVLLVFTLLPLPYMNISALVTGTALFISLFRNLASAALLSAGSVRRAFLIGVTVAAICSLKHSLIPACILLLIVGYVVHLFASGFKRRFVVEMVTAAVFAGVFVLPWVHSMYMSFGTALYPILGTGPRAEIPSSAEDVPAVSGVASLVELGGILSSEMTSTFVLPLVIFGLAVQVWQPPNPLHRNLLFAFLASSLLGVLILAVGMIGTSTYRFCFPFVSAAILICMTDLLTPGTESHGGSHAQTIPLVAVALAAGLLIGWTWEPVRYVYLGLVKGIGAGIMDAGANSQEERLRYRQMQASIPENETLLTRLEKPFLLDFRRNTVFIVDNPGGAPPSIPRFQSAEQIASYLVGRSIRYLAYSYGTEAGVPKRMFGNPEEDPSTYYRHILDFQSMLEELGRSRQRIYDDGDIFVLDLTQIHH